MAADRNDFENAIEHEELPPVNIMNITGMVSNDVSIGTSPWKPVKKLPSKPMQPPSRPTLSEKSQLSPSQELVNRSQQTTPGNLFHHSMQTLASPTADLYHSLTQSNDEEAVADSSNVAAAVALQAEVDQLKNEVAALVLMNNRYHLAISNCTFCVSADVNTSNASTVLDASIGASTPACQSPRSGASFALPSSGPAPALQSRTIPALMSLTIDDRIKAEVDTMQKRKDKAFISKMVKTLTKLEAKYLIPRHRSKKQLFTRKQENGPSFLFNSHTNQLKSLAKNFMIFAYVPNPNVSSDDASTEANDDQSDPETIKSLNISDESRTSTASTSLSLGQDSLFYQNLASSPSPPLARNSPTTDLLLDMSYEVAPLIPETPLLSKLPPRRRSVISCPAGTGDEQFIAINLSSVNYVFLEHNGDVIDHVSIGNNSPKVVPVHHQNEEAIPVPPPPNADHEDLPQCGLCRVDFRCLHKYAREGEDAWSQSRQEKQEGGHRGGHPGGDGGHRGQGCARLITRHFRLSKCCIEYDGLNYILT